MSGSVFAPPHPLNTAVLFLVFNRPDTTKQVFEAIRKAEPPRLYIASDGPRPDRAGEKEKVKVVREYVMANIDWACEVKTLFREENLGCKYAVSGAITWFFAHEEMGIILEDDCLPSQSFFWFCEALLLKYQEDSRIYLVSGFNVSNTMDDHCCDYFFSSYEGIWGWASWRRVWKQYDVEMALWNNTSACNAIKNVVLDDAFYKKLVELFSRVQRGQIDTWDYQLSFIKLTNNGLAVIPSKNLIVNIGFGEEATHTKGQNIYSNNLLHNYIFPLEENTFVVPNRLYDKNYISKQIIKKSYAVSILKKIPFTNIIVKIVKYIRDTILKLRD